MCDACVEPVLVFGHRAVVGWIVIVCGSPLSWGTHVMHSRRLWLWRVRLCGFVKLL